MRATILVAALLGFLVGWSDYIVTLLIGGGQLLTAPVLLGSAAAGAGNDAAVAVMALATRRRAQQYLRLVQLEGFGRRSVSSLSGGQQQRVALARALAAERGALLLDEPFSSLDRELRVSMHDLLTEVRAALSPTVLLVTHDLDEAALAESTVGLIDGAVQQQAPMAELYRRPASLAVARLLGGFAEIPGTVRDGVHHSAWGLPGWTSALRSLGQRRS